MNATKAKAKALQARLETASSMWELLVLPLIEEAVGHGYDFVCIDIIQNREAWGGLIMLIRGKQYDVQVYDVWEDDDGLIKQPIRVSW